MANEPTDIFAQPPGPLIGSTPLRSAQPPLKPRPRPSDHKDSFREILETIVFVIVLVLLLKTFIAEAFVIPTGSMATTLLGYHRNITCPQCGHRFPLNVSKQEDAQEERVPILGCTCENCRYHMDFTLGLPAPEGTTIP